MSWRLAPLALCAIAVLAQGVPPPTASRDACDLDLIHVRAEQSFAGYRIEARRDDAGIVTLLLRPRTGAGMLAVALRARGTQLTTSVAGTGIVGRDIALVSQPIADWWKDAELQAALANCTGSASETTDLATAARDAMQPGRRQWAAPLRTTLVLGVGWIVLACILCAIVRRSVAGMREGVALLTLFPAAFVLNWLLCAGGPGDLRLNLAAVWWPNELDLRWGPAPVALFRFLALVLGELRDVEIRWTNLMLSSLLPILLYSLVWRLGVSKRASLMAACVAAGHPLLIAFSGDLGRQPTYLFAALGSLLGLVEFLRGGGIGAALAFVLGAALATASRPEGGHVLVVAGAIALFAPATVKQRGLALVGLALLGGLAFLYVRYLVAYGADLATQTRVVFADPSALQWTVVLDGDYTPVAWIEVWLAGLLLGIRKPAAWIAIAALAGLHVAWSLTGLYDTFVGYSRQVASARYETILLVPLVIGTALFADAVLRGRTWLRSVLLALFVAGTVMTYARPYDTLLQPFTVDREYLFIQRHAAALPSASTLYILQPPTNDVGFVDADLVGLFTRLDVRFDLWNPLRQPEPPSATGAYVYIGSACAALIDQPRRPLGADYPRWLRECASIRDRLQDLVIEEITVPARKMSWHEFRDSELRLGLYRLGADSTPLGRSP